MINNGELFCGKFSSRPIQRAGLIMGSYFAANLVVGLYSGLDFARCIGLLLNLPQNNSPLLIQPAV